MSLFAGETVFNASNIGQLVGNGKSVFAGGEMRLLSRVPPPSDHNPRLYSVPFGDRFKVYPRSEWPERLKTQEKYQARNSDAQNYPPHDQDGLPTCWANGPAGAMTLARVRQGLPYKQISANSVAVPISGGHSGGYEGAALEYYAKHGGCGVDVWPNNSTDRSLMSDPKVAEDRKHHIALEWLDCGSNFDCYATACLMGFPCAVAYNWWSHVVMVVDLVEISPGRFGLRIRNNWGKWGAANIHGFYGYQVLEEGHGTPGSGFALCQITPSII